MSKIKNKRELVLRADGHRRHDRIKQGTYGDASVNGHAEFKGCAIGCLSTPHRKPELRSFLRGIFGGAGSTEGRYASVPGLESDDQTARLKREFGICEPLARFAESVFEGCETHGAAIEFIPAFARALPEGVNITPRQVERKFRALLEETATEGARPWIPYTSLGTEIVEEDHPGFRDGFLSWLRGLA